MHVKSLYRALCRAALSQFPKVCVLYLHQSSMPISSSPVSTPSAWCHVVWEKTRRCILSSARPWCTQRRPSPSRDASLSSTTLTVSRSSFPSPLSCLSTLSCLSSHPAHFVLFILHPVSFSPPRPLSCFFPHGHFVLPCSCFPPHLIIFLSLLIRHFSSHHY